MAQLMAAPGHDWDSGQMYDRNSEWGTVATRPRSDIVLGGVLD
jgi:hypothetical protein